MVDLDGARAGVPANLEHLRRIAGELGVPVQFGGGLRSLTAIEGAIEAGAARVILGTAAFTDATLLDEALRAMAGQGARVGGRARGAGRHGGLDRDHRRWRRRT